MRYVLFYGFCIYARGDTFKSKKYIYSLNKVFPIETLTVKSIKRGVWRLIPTTIKMYFLLSSNLPMMINFF